MLAKPATQIDEERRFQRMHSESAHVGILSNDCINAVATGFQYRIHTR